MILLKNLYTELYIMDYLLDPEEIEYTSKVGEAWKFYSIEDKDYLDFLEYADKEYCILTAIEIVGGE